jgi:Aspartyl protease
MFFFAVRLLLSGYMMLLCASIALGAERTQAHGTGNRTSIRFTLQDNLIRIPARINGQTVSAVLDSGSSWIALDQLVSDRLKIAHAQAGGDSGGAGAKAHAAYPLRIDTLQAGPLQLSQVPGMATDLQSLTTSAGFPIDVILGAPVFEHQVISIDYPGRRISFSAAAPPSFCRNPVPLKLLGGAVPIVEVKLLPSASSAPVTLQMVVDLGTRHYAAVVGGPFLRTTTGTTLLSKGVSKQIGMGTGGAVQGTAVQISALEMAGQHYGPLEIALTDQVKVLEQYSLDGTLGVPLWSSGVIVFDYPHERLCLSKS